MVGKTAHLTTNYQQIRSAERKIFLSNYIQSFLTDDINRYGHLTYMASDYLSLSATGYYFPLGHPLRDEFALRLLWMSCSGVADGRYRHHAFRMKSEVREYLRHNDGGDDETATATATAEVRGVVLGMIHVLPMFLLFFLGLAASACVFVTREFFSVGAAAAAAGQKLADIPLVVFSW